MQAAALITKVSKNIAEKLVEGRYYGSYKRKCVIDHEEKGRCLSRLEDCRYCRKDSHKGYSVPGGVFSGGLAYYTFKPSAERLANTFEKLLKGYRKKTIYQ